MKEYFCNVVRDSYGIGLKIYLGYQEGKDIYVLINNEAVKVEPLEQLHEATISVSSVVLAQEDGLLRSLVDGLIAHGIKPSKPIKNTQELDAIKYHLEDMRKIVFEEKG